MLEANSSQSSSKKRKVEEKENNPFIVEFSFDKSGFISSESKV
jgi:hypothetical protein